MRQSHNVTSAAATSASSAASIGQTHARRLVRFQLRPFVGRQACVVEKGSGLPVSKRKASDPYNPVGSTRLRAILRLLRSGAAWCDFASKCCFHLGDKLGSDGFGQAWPRIDHDLQIGRLLAVRRIDCTGFCSARLAPIARSPVVAVAYGIRFVSRLAQSCARIFAAR